MIGRASNGVRQDGGVLSIVFLLVSRGRGAKQVRVVRVGKDDQVHRVGLSTPFEGVCLRQVGGPSSDPRYESGLCSRRSMVGGEVVRRGLAYAVGSAVCHDRLLGVILCSLCSNRHLTILVLCRHVLFGYFDRRVCFQRLPSDLGAEILYVGGFPFNGYRFRFQVGCDGRVNRYVLGAIRCKGYARRHRHDRYRSAREGDEGSVSNVILFL